MSRPLSGTGAVFRHELRLLLYAPLSYLFQMAILVALSVSVFLIADFYSTDEASIRPMLTFLPWVALIFVPALAMRAWIDEHSDRGVELLLTLPVTLGAAVLGKFLAGYLVLMVTLLFTLPLLATIYFLGDPDPGIVVAGYLALALMLGAYYAIALFAGALAREQVGAFVIGIVVLFVLLVMGWDVFARVLKDQASPAVIDILTLYSPATWVNLLSRGWIDFAGIFYFVAVIGAALAATRGLIRNRISGTASLLRAPGLWAKALFGIGLLALAIPLAARLPGGVDLTAEKEFTPHQGSLDVLAKLPVGTEITLYWSAHESSVPAPIKSHARNIEALLQTLTAGADDRVTLRIVDPLPDTDEELRAEADGVRRIPMSSGDHFFLGATFRHGRRVGNIPYLDLRRDRFIEYDIAVALNGLTRSRTPKIGVISPLIPTAAALGERPGMSFIGELKRAYDLAVIPFFEASLPDGLDALLLIDTALFKKEMLYAIDQFVIGGGSLIVMIDPYLRFNRASNAVNPQPSGEINDISDLLQKYGLRYRGEAVVGDEGMASPVADEDQGRMSFPYWMRIGEAGISRSHPVSADLNEVFMVEPGAFELLNPARTTALISTTENSGVLDRRHFAAEKPRQLARGFKADGARRVIAAAAAGPFDSAFATPPAGVDATRHLARSTGPGVVFAVADVDWLFDPFSLQRADLGGRVVIRPLNDNLALLLNMVGYAGGDAGLIGIRSRGKIRRPFTRIAELFKAAEKKYREQETALAQRAAEIERRIAALPGAMDAAGIDQLPPEIRDGLSAFRKELLSVRRKLRAVRRDIRREVDGLGQRLTAINLAAGPTLVVLFAGFVLARRRRRMRG